MHRNLSSFTVTSLSACIVWKPGGVVLVIPEAISGWNYYYCLSDIRSVSSSGFQPHWISSASNLTFPMTMKTRNSLNFLLLSLLSVPTLHPRHLLFSLDLRSYFRHYFGFTKVQSAAPPSLKISKWRISQRFVKTNLTLVKYKTEQKQTTFNLLLLLNSSIWCESAISTLLFNHNLCFYTVVEINKCK